MFIILSGCSGVGKNTVIRELLKRNKNIKTYKTCTTRPNVRAEEKVNSEYIHLTRGEFKNKIDKGELFEFEEIHGNFYGTLKESVDQMRKDNLIKDIGVEGQISFVKNLPKDIKVVSVFLYAPKDELIKRLTERGEQEIEKRMKRFEYENELSKNYDYIIDNSNLENTLKKMEEIIEKHS
ncbi:MAG: AAA family ATPase [Clostridia bacterium]|nr:AAA family ATPase [Clostridia bacterium]